MRSAIPITIGMDQSIAPWEKTYRQSQLTLWVLLALFNGSKDMTVTRYSVQEMTDFQLDYTENSLYRALRRLEQDGYLRANYILATTPFRPAAKMYCLTTFGRHYLQQFVHRNRTILPERLIKDIFDER